MKRLSMLGLLCLPFSAFSAENYLVTQVKDLKVKQCLPKITALSNYLIEDKKAGGNTIYDSKDANKGPLHAITETVFSDASTLSLMSFFPDSDGGCPAIYATVYYFDEPCIAQTKSLSGYEYQGLLQANVSFFKSKSANAYLLPAGRGCVLLKQEMATDMPSK